MILIPFWRICYFLCKFLFLENKIILGNFNICTNSIILCWSWQGTLQWHTQSVVKVVPNIKLPNKMKWHKIKPEVQSCLHCNDECLLPPSLCEWQVKWGQMVPPKLPSCLVSRSLLESAKSSFLLSSTPTTWPKTHQSQSRVDNPSHNFLGTY
jgi:hypothetical protein